jgi:transmembrane sensor
VNTDYTKYGIIDLAIDDAFLQHYLLPTPKSENFWDNWLRDNPDKAADWEAACKLVEAVLLGLTDYTRIYLTKEAEEDLLERIWTTNHATQQPNKYAININLWKQSHWMAASVLLALLAGAYWFVFQNNTADSIYSKQIAELQNPVIEKINDLTEPQLFYLPDSTSVLLYPRSKMSYATIYGDENRNVYLSGKAIFDVRKNPRQPFLVYANEIITKVLGTHFEIQAFEKDTDVIVKVQSGQVSVYQEKSFEHSNTINSEKSGVLLLPNQQVVFKRTAEQFNKAIVEQPILLPAASVARFVYDEAPVSQVLKDIEAAYGVDIVYSSELLQSCDLTANLTEEPMRGKLDIICRSISATYEIVDAQIIITSTGCKKN